MRSIALLCTSLCVLPATTAVAHYLWIGVNDEGDSQTVNVYFQEGARPGPGKYLDPFVENGKTWVRTPGMKATPLPVAETKGDGTRWLSGPLDTAAPRSIESTGTYGVYRYGKTDVLLHYRAKYVDATGTKDLDALARAEALDLDVVPAWRDGKLTVTVLWKGEPAVGRTVKIRGAKFHVNVKTDDAGVVTFEPPAAGRFTFLTNVDYPREGEHGGKAYTLVRHHSSLSIALPVGE